MTDRSQIPLPELADYLNGLVGPVPPTIALKHLQECLQVEYRSGGIGYSVYLAPVDIQTNVRCTMTRNVDPKPGPWRIEHDPKCMPETCPLGLFIDEHLQPQGKP